MTSCYEINRTEKDHVTWQACQALGAEESEMINTSVKHVKHETCQACQTQYIEHVFQNI